LLWMLPGAAGHTSSQTAHSLVHICARSVTDRRTDGISELIYRIWQFPPPPQKKKLRNLMTLSQIFHKNPLYQSHWIFFWSSNGENLP
jgi:hypothetical protein